MAAKFGVEAAPTLLVACNGDPATAERFEGEFKSGPITDFLSKFAGGRKCATAVKVSPGHVLFLRMFIFIGVYAVSPVS